MLEATPGDREWLAQQFEALTTHIEVMKPSEWAETYRYLPPGATPIPGYFRFSVAPYLREIVDCLSIDSPVRAVSVMKGVQLCFTTGVLENAIGYFIAHVKTAPMMMVTADAELAHLRVETAITPMLQLSQLDHLIKSSDEKNARKTGKTDKKIEWVGGGFLIPFGAQNANKLRSIPIRVMLRDEIDAWPDLVGKDGDPLKLSEDRTAAYESSRKILDISTPLVQGLSKIASRFAQGDQRRYFVCCVGCGHAQILRWTRTHPETGQVSGITWEMADGRLVPGSARYVCESCGYAHTNDDKTRLLSPEHGAEWRPTATPEHPDHRSYHINALYSPVGMQTWDACVSKWLDAWDVEHGRAKDLGKLQVFYNNVLGETFELKGEKVRFEMVSLHRRHSYSFGEIPNRFALEHCGSEVLLVTCAVDVHADNLAVATFGWTRGRRAILVDYWRFEGPTELIDEPSTWGRLRELIEQREYVADDGKRYRIQLTLIDSGYRADDVYRFCADYEAGVFPVKGRDAGVSATGAREFASFTTPLGQAAYGVTVDIYKDRWSAALRRGWDGLSHMPEGHFSAPINASDRQLKELTVETKHARVDARTGKRLGYEWHRPSGAANELWDLLVYASAAVDIIAMDVSKNELGHEHLNLAAFYDVCTAGRYYTE